MTDMLDCAPESQEYQDRYITHLVKKGLPHGMAEQDYKARIREVIMDMNESNPEMDAEESFSYWID